VARDEFGNLMGGEITTFNCNSTEQKVQIKSTKLAKRTGTLAYDEISSRSI